MDEADRNALAEEVARGSSEALQRLLVDYHKSLRQVVEHGLENDLTRKIEADDVLQEAYISAFQAVSKREFKLAEEHSTPAAGLYRWLEAIALNSLKDRRRALLRQKRDVRREVATGLTNSTSYPDLARRLTSDQTTPSRLFARGEAEAVLLSSLARLPSEQRAVVRLRFLEGHAVADIARRLGKSEGAIHTLCYRGLKSLRGLMDGITPYLTGL